MWSTVILAVGANDSIRGGAEISLEAFKARYAEGVNLLEAAVRNVLLATIAPVATQNPLGDRAFNSSPIAAFNASDHPSIKSVGSTPLRVSMGRCRKTSRLMGPSKLSWISPSTCGH